SRAALQRVRGDDRARTILGALAANGVIAIAKLISGLLSGSTALLAEAAHSLADASNEVFLGISLSRAAAPADDRHPLGHGRERFLWAFMAAMASFLIGGCVSIGPAVRERGGGGFTRSRLPPWGVRGGRLVTDRSPLLPRPWQATREPPPPSASPRHYRR